MDSGWLVVAWLWWAAPGQTLDPDLSDLSLLPLDKLLAVKRSLAQYQPSEALYCTLSKLSTTKL